MATNEPEGQNQPLPPPVTQVDPRTLRPGDVIIVTGEDPTDAEWRRWLAGDSNNPPPPINLDDEPFQLVIDGREVDHNTEKVLVNAAGEPTVVPLDLPEDELEPTQILPPTDRSAPMPLGEPIKPLNVWHLFAFLVFVISVAFILRAIFQ